MKYFEAFAEPGYHSAFMTTYAFGTHAFEDIPFPKLRGAGCRNIVVLADAQMANQAFCEFGTPRFAGSSYHIIKANAPAAFHPKITMLIGATKGRLMIGSANLTALGLGGNRELIANIAFALDRPNHAHLFASTLAYIRRYVPVDDPWFSIGLQRAMRGAPWLREAAALPEGDGTIESDIAVLTDRSNVTFIDQITRCIDNDPIKRLVVLSPYWDMKLEGLSLLRTALGMPPTDLLIEGSVGNFPKRELTNFSGLEMFDVEQPGSGRFVHAKLILALGSSADHVISGSMNCTYPALMGLSMQSGNAEAGVYKRLSAGKALQALGLEAYRNKPLNVSDISELTYLPTEGNEEAKYVDGGTLTFQAGHLSWKPPFKLTREAYRLTLFDREGHKIDSDISLTGAVAQSWYPNLEGVRPKYGHILFSDGSASAPVQVVDLDVLAVATLPPQRGPKKRLIETLAETLHEDLIIIEALNQLEVLEIEERAHGEHGKEKPARSKMPNAEAYGVLPYEEFVRARTIAREHGDGARTLLNGQHESAANILSKRLNQLIGLVSRDLGADEEQDIQGIAAFDFRTTEPQVASDVSPSTAAVKKQKPIRKNAEDRATAKKIQEAVAAFEERCKSLRGKPVLTSEFVRLRALIQIVMSHAQPVKGLSLPTQVLPVYAKEGYDWPRLIGRLLLQHFGTARAIQHLHVEPDEGEQLRVIEYLAIASWAARAASIAAHSHGDSAALRIPIARLVDALRTQTEAVMSVVADDKRYFQEVTSRLEERFRSRLGL